MSDVVIFAFGCMVSLIVASAVGFLLWGVANEPREELQRPSGLRSTRPQPGSTGDRPSNGVAPAWDRSS